MFGTTFSQVVPPAAALTEDNMPDLAGKVYIVTGGASGIGYELSSMLYHAGGKVYIAGRSGFNAHKAIEAIQVSCKGCENAHDGQLNFLHLELDDLETIKGAVEKFLSRESRLDVLYNNAGLAEPPVGSRSEQGTELMMATNCLGPYLLTQLLLPVLEKTAGSSPAGSVRVVWTSSLSVETSPPEDGRIPIESLDLDSRDQAAKYMYSKLGNWYLGSELARAQADKQSPVLSITQNPGLSRTHLLRHASQLTRIATSPMQYSPKMGAYTGLWAGLSRALTPELNGAYVIPWGRIHPSPPQQAPEHAAVFRQWCEEKTGKYA